MYYQAVVMHAASGILPQACCAAQCAIKQVKECALQATGYTIRGDLGMLALSQPVSVAEQGAYCALATSASALTC